MQTRADILKKSSSDKSTSAQLKTPPSPQSVHTTHQFINKFCTLSERMYRLLWRSWVQIRLKTFAGAWTNVQRPQSQESNSVYQLAWTCKSWPNQETEQNIAQNVYKQIFYKQSDYKQKHITIREHHQTRTSNFMLVSRCCCVPVARWIPAQISESPTIASLFHQPSSEG